jgi:cytochrome c peroxidase
MNTWVLITFEGVFEMTDVKKTKLVFCPTHWLIGLVFLFGVVALSAQNAPWTPQELKAINGLWLGNLSQVPKDASNQFESLPSAIEFGKNLFFDKQLSGNQDVSCSSCHNPEKKFGDDQKFSEGMGLTTRHTPSIIGAAYSPYQFWDGRADSLWAQALGPLENPVEHGMDRTQLVRIVMRLYPTELTGLFASSPDFTNLERFPERASPIGDKETRENWQKISPQDQELVNRAFSTIGKVIAAFVRTIKPQVTPFDLYAESLMTGKSPEIRPTEDELAGLRLFIGKANCVACHNTPLFTDQQFHNTGIPQSPSKAADLGRFTGLREVLKDEFNCRSIYSDAAPNQCLALAQAELDVLESDATPSKDNKNAAAFKTPSLRNVMLTMPLMHNGQFKNLKQTLDHYNQAPKSQMGTSELKPLRLNQAELAQLQRFLETLTEIDGLR